MEKMKQHTMKYTPINFSEEVTTIRKTNELFTITTDISEYQVKAILLCTGTEYRKLNAPGEKEFTGKGVSYCATCDGFFFKDKKVVVIGGGNSALIESIFLKQIGCKEVYLIHRRDQLRAENTYQEEAVEKKVHIMYNTHVESIQGKDKVEFIEIHDVKTNKKSNFQVDGVFISIGEEPQNQLAKQLNIALDVKGFVIVDKQCRTNVKGVYAAGDITGGLRQIITACAEGAIAALASTEALGKKYPY
jgi:thioredoxin reductase (NADPH)